MICQLEGPRFVAEIAVSKRTIESTLDSLQRHFPQGDYRAVRQELEVLNEVTPRVMPAWLPIEPLVRDWLALRARVEKLFIEVAIQHAERRTDAMIDNVIRPDFQKKAQR